MGHLEHRPQLGCGVGEADKAHVAEFVKFYAANDAAIAEAAAYIPLNDEAAAALVSAVEAMG